MQAFSFTSPSRFSAPKPSLCCAGLGVTQDAFGGHEGEAPETGAAWLLISPTVSQAAPLLQLDQAVFAGGVLLQ